MAHSVISRQRSNRSLLGGKADILSTYSLNAQQFLGRARMPKRREVELAPITLIIGSDKSLTKLSSPLRNGRQAFFIASASRTRSGVKGYRVSRTPVASKNALAIAAPAAPITSSPAPVEGSLIL